MLVRPPASRARSGASVSFAEQAGPGQVPQGREQRGVVGADRPDRVGQGAEEVRAAAGQRVEHRRVQLAGGERRGRGRAA